MDQEPTQRTGSLDGIGWVLKDIDLTGSVTFSSPRKFIPNWGETLLKIIFFSGIITISLLFIAFGITAVSFAIRHF